ncbi:MAG: GNAT family N-acetyltransferase [Patescibacteria group bacterium]|jgi:hypothetical protein
MNIYLIDKLTLEDHFASAKLEKNYFSDDLIADPKVTWGWYAKNPETYVMAKDCKTGEIIGHLLFLPIDDYLFELIKSGNYVDTNITPEHIITYNKPGIYKLYFCVVCVAPLYRQHNISRLMIEAYAKKFRDLKSRGIIFSEVIADAVTLEGVRFCERALGMRAIQNSAHNSHIMQVSGDDFYKILLNLE